MSEVQHFGSCHCGAVKWSFTGPEVLDGCRCKERIKSQSIVLTLGLLNTSSVRFVGFKASIIRGLTQTQLVSQNPRGVRPSRRGLIYQKSIMPHCIDGKTLKGVNWTYFNGQEWEKTMETKAPAAQ
nr:hypothetical protein F25B4.8 - Caenorhabditis elegans [Caenorhabditis elegans]